METFRTLFHSPIGDLLIESNGSAITAVSRQLAPGCRRIDEGNDPVTILAVQQLIEFFRGERTSFSVPIAPEGTLFQQRVWRELLKIGYGEVRSYSFVAESLGSERAVRAVGGAIGKNPILVLIPCHRVIAKDGTLAGFSAGLDAKIKLLELERFSRSEFPLGESSATLPH